MSKGSDLIAVERARQVSKEGWTPEHDAEHDSGQLVDAALCYVACVRDERLDQPPFWPWDRAYWKPSTPTRMLVKAGALIAAEIDRRIAVGEDDLTSVSDDAKAFENSRHVNREAMEVELSYHDDLIEMGEAMDALGDGNP